MAIREKVGEKSTEIQIDEIKREVVLINVVGRTPIILNRLSEKARHTLLFPAPKKNTAERAAGLKHNPLAEFRSAAHTIRDESSPTLLAMPSTAFKGVLRSAALDAPGASKAQMGRLTFVEGDYVAIYGVPQLLMSTVRSSDVARTPDVRTRVIVPHWAATIKVHFVSSIIKAKSVMNLLAQGGLTIGVGDWRPEKGNGSYGQFEVGVAADDPVFAKIVRDGGRAEQKAALDNPQPYDQESEDLLSWFDVELKRRGFKVAA